MIAALASSVMVIRAWRACSLQAWSFCAFGRSGNQLGRDCKQACAALRWLDYAPGMECKGFRLESWTYEGARLELPEAEPLGCGASGACTKAAQQVCPIVQPRSIPQVLSEVTQARGKVVAPGKL